MAGTYADLFHGTTYGTFNGPLYGSGPPPGVTAIPGYFESRRELGIVVGEEQPSLVRGELARLRRREPVLISAQEPRIQRRSERL